MYKPDTAAAVRGAAEDAGAGGAGTAPRCRWRRPFRGDAAALPAAAEGGTARPEPRVSSAEALGARPPAPASPPGAPRPQDVQEVSVAGLGPGSAGKGKGREEAGPLSPGLGAALAGAAPRPPRAAPPAALGCASGTRSVNGAESLTCPNFG